MTEGQLARARATTLGNLRAQGFNTALGAATGDADRSTQASLANAQTALQNRAQTVGFRPVGAAAADGGRAATGEPFVEL